MLGNSDKKNHPGRRNTLKYLVTFIAASNVASLLYFFGPMSLGEEGLEQAAYEMAVGGDSEGSTLEHRQRRFVPRRSSGKKLIHIVKDKSWNWHESEFGPDGFKDCPHFSNCKVQEHFLSSDSSPEDIPTYGSLVLFTAEAMETNPNSAFWSEAGSKRPFYLMWGLHAMSHPFNTPLDFLSFRNYRFNLTLTYKPDSDVFTPVTFWNTEDHSARSRVGGFKNRAANKTRKVLWLIDGPCSSVNDRMRYATELSAHIGVDIIGHCVDDEGITHQVDKSTHGNELRRGVIDDYKFYLSFEEISCRDYITKTFFDISAKQNIIPVVMGAQKEAYDIVGPPDSYIHIDDFSGPKDLAKHLLKLDENDHLYNQYFRHVGTGEFRLPISSMCRLCDIVNYYEETDFSQSYSKDDFTSFWSDSDCNLNRLREDLSSNGVESDYHSIRDVEEI